MIINSLATIATYYPLHSGALHSGSIVAAHQHKQRMSIAAWEESLMEENVCTHKNEIKVQ